MSTIINSGVFDDGCFPKKGGKSCGCDDSCNCHCHTSSKSLCFCKQQLPFLATQGTVTVRGNGGNIYIGTISSVQCDFFTITVPTPAPAGSTVPPGTYTIPCPDGVESIAIGIVV